MFGQNGVEIQTENSPFNPASTYGCAKTFAYYLTRYYRQAFGIFASSAIFFNHESPRRTPEYVTRKITRAVARIKLGKQDRLVLGDLTAKIDWGYSKEYMEAAWQILQQDKPDDFIIATGEVHSIEEFVNEAFSYVDLDPTKYVSSNKKFFRPTKTGVLRADISKARNTFGFDPKIKFKELIKIMIDADLEMEK